MKTRILTALLMLGGVIGSDAFAQGVILRSDDDSATRSADDRRAVSPRIPGRVLTAEPAAPAGDSVAEDLQRIVVLCATEPESEAFKTAWVSYVRTHRVTERNLDALIDDVIQRAQAYRAERSNSRTNRALLIITTTKTMMHDTAKAAINNIR